MTNQFHADRGIDAGPANGPRLLLADHHRGIEAAYRRMLASIYADDARDLVRDFRTFERAILEHLAAEEDVILPAYALEAPQDAAQIRADHARIREALIRAGIDTDLHTMRAHNMKGLIEALRTHAAHEDERMYPWAQIHLPLSSRRGLFVRLGRSLRTLAAIAERAATPVPR